MALKRASLLSIAVGAFIGAGTALVTGNADWPSPGPHAPLHELAASAVPSAAGSAAAQPPPSSSASPAAATLVPASDTVPSTQSTDSADGAPVPHGFEDLIPSPHDHPITTEEELRKSERLCIADLPYQCMRVADAYAKGEVVRADGRRRNQYKNLAFRLYIKQCESHVIEACYSLARMYLRGDGVKANPAYAQNLMKRVLELCGYKRVKLCSRLESEAPEVIQRHKDGPERDRP